MKEQNESSPSAMESCSSAVAGGQTKAPLKNFRKRVIANEDAQTQRSSRPINKAQSRKKQLNFRKIL